MGDSTATATPTRTEVVRFEINLPNDGTTDVRASDLLTELIYVARRALVDMENGAKWIRSFDSDAHALFLADHLETSRRDLQQAAEAMDACAWKEQLEGEV